MLKLDGNFFQVLYKMPHFQVKCRLKQTNRKKCMLISPFN